MASLHIAKNWVSHYPNKSSDFWHEIHLKADGTFEIMKYTLLFQDAIYYIGTYTLEENNRIKLVITESPKSHWGGKEIYIHNYPQLDPPQTITLQYYLEEGKFPMTEQCLKGGIFYYKYKCRFKILEGDFKMGWLVYEKLNTTEPLSVKEELTELDFYSEDFDYEN